jgi:hypothetical protein
VSEHGFTTTRIESDLARIKERKHAPLSPSVLKSKAICPGYFSDPTGDSSFADRGTLGHKAVELEDPSLCGDDTGLRKAVEKCIAYKIKVTGRGFSGYRGMNWAETGPNPTEGVFQEIRLDYFDQYGFCDLIRVWHKEVDVVDWKFAYRFYPADSPQFHAYCLGVWDKWPAVETIRVHVPHPFRDEIDLETFTRSKDYSRLSGQVAAIIARAKANDPSTYTISEQCAYCGFAGRCSKLAGVGLEIARRYSPDLQLPPGSLHGSEVTDPKVFATLLHVAPAVEKAVSGWKRAALDMWDAGTAIPDFEIASRSGRRSIASAKAAYEVVKDKVPVDQFLEACSVSPTQLEDLYVAAFPRGQKQKAKEVLEGLLVDQEILTAGGESRHLRPIRK